MEGAHSSHELVIEDAFLPAPQYSQDDDALVEDTYPLAVSQVKQASSFPVEEKSPAKQAMQDLDGAS